MDDLSFEAFIALTSFNGFQSMINNHVNEMKLEELGKIRMCFIDTSWKQMVSNPYRGLYI